MSNKSHVVIKVVSTGIGHQLANKLIELAKEAISADSGVTVEALQNSLSSSTDAVQLNLNFEFNWEIDGLLFDWWNDHCTEVLSSDPQASGIYIHLKGNTLESYNSWGSNVGVSYGIQVEPFKFDDLEIDSELKGQPGIEQFTAYFEQETSLEANVTIYAKNRAEALEKAHAIVDSDLIYSDSMRLEQVPVQII